MKWFFSYYVSTCKIVETLESTCYFPQYELAYSAITVLKETKGTRPSVWSKIGVLWAKITYLKSAAMLFFKQYPNRYCLGLSNELLFITIAQEAAKLWPFKVGGPKEKSYPGPTRVMRVRLALNPKCQIVSNFDRSQFCNPLTYDDAQ